MKKIILLAAILSITNAMAAGDNNKLSCDPLKMLENAKIINGYSQGDLILRTLGGRDLTIPEQQLAHKKQEKTLLKALKEVTGTAKAKTTKYQAIIDDIASYIPEAPKQEYQITPEDKAGMAAYIEDDKIKFEQIDNPLTAKDKLQNILHTKYDNHSIFDGLTQADKEVIILYTKLEANKPYNMLTMSQEGRTILAEGQLRIDQEGQLADIPAAGAGEDH